MRASPLEGTRELLRAAGDRKGRGFPPFPQAGLRVTKYRSARVQLRCDSSPAPPAGLMPLDKSAEDTVPQPVEQLAMSRMAAVHDGLRAIADRLQTGTAETNVVGERREPPAEKERRCALARPLCVLKITSKFYR